MKKHPLLLFFIIAFAITWGLGSLNLIFPSEFEAAFGEMDLSKPFYKAFFHPAVYGPPIAAFVVVALGPRNLGKTKYTEAVPLVAEGE